MFRGLQFAFPEGAIFISCVDQKLLTLQEIMDNNNFYHQNILLDAFRMNSRNIIGRNPSVVIPLLANQDLTPMLHHALVAKHKYHFPWQEHNRPMIVTVGYLAIIASCSVALVFLCTVM